MSELQQRFETWFQEKYWSLAKHGIHFRDGEYNHYDVQLSWDGFQSGAGHVEEA